MVDRYGRRINYLRLSVTDRCNLCCRYCMPAQGVRRCGADAYLTEDEMLLIVQAAAELGITKLRITGGEPLVREDILSICRRAAAVPGIEEVNLTTNGVHLAEYARPLRECGVSRINISLDTLDPEKYTYITRGGELEKVLCGLEAALAAGFDRVKVNAVLIGGFNTDELRALSELTLSRPVDVRFIELMPMIEGQELSAAQYVPATEVLRAVGTVEPVESPTGTARLYKIPGAMGNIGLITPVSNHFCHSCNRLRVTADGKLKPCLHSGEEYALKGLPLEAVREQLRLAVSEKPSWHGELGPDHISHAGRDMHRIGG